MRKSTRKILILILLTTTSFFLSCQKEKIIEDPWGMIKTRLKNGVTVIISENHKSPLVSLTTRVKVGTRNEREDQVGIAHLIELMHLKGTTKRPLPTDIPEQAKLLGAKIHSQSSEDDTVYSMTLPSSYFEQGLELHSDGILNMKLDPTELSKETEVIIQEIKQRQDNPHLFARDQLKKLVFQKNKLKFSSLGLEDTLRKLTRTDVLQFYRDTYRPNQMIVTIVGDIHSKEALKSIRRLYEPLEEKEVPGSLTEQELPQTELQFKRSIGDIQDSLLFIGFRAPAFSHPDTDALRLLSLLLRNIHGTIKKLTNHMEVRLSSFEDAGIFNIQFSLDAKNIPEVESIIFSEIERLKRGIFTESDLARIKSQLELKYFMRQERTTNLAHDLSHFERYGDYSLIRRNVENMMAVTGADIQRVAAFYLNIHQSSIFEYIGRDTPIESYSSQYLEARLKRESLLPSGSSTSTQPEASPGVPSEALFTHVKPSLKKVPSQLKRYQLSNNAILLLREDHEWPLVSMDVLFRGGRLYESKNQSGITQLMLTSSLTGTTTRSEEQIQDRFSELGAIVRPICEEDFFGYSLTVLQRNLDEALKVLSDVILHPSFSIDRLPLEKAKLIAKINRSEDSSASYGFSLLREAAFKNHPYGTPTFGFKKAILKISPDDLIQWHTKCITSSDMIMSAVGNFINLDMRASMENYFKIIPPRRNPAPEIEEVHLPSFISENFRERQKEQTTIILGFDAVPQNHENELAFKLMQSLTSHAGGRFWTKLRSQEKLTATVSSQSHSYLKGGVFTISTSVSPEEEKKTIRFILDEFKKLHDEPVSKRELIMAQNILITQWSNELQSIISEAYVNATHELYGKPITQNSDRLTQIKSITAENLNDLALNYFNLENYTLGIVRGVQKSRSIISTPTKPIVTPKPKPKVLKKPPVPESIPPATPEESSEKKTEEKKEEAPPTTLP